MIRIASAGKAIGACAINPVRFSHGVPLTADYKQLEPWPFASSATSHERVGPIRSR